MKKLIAVILSMVLMTTLSGAALAANYQPTGNGALSGPHYNLNIIGVPKDKTADMTNNNGHRIFVSLEGKAKIKLIEGDDFAVLDANGTKGSASFQLPNPDPDGDGTTVYSVWARPVGKPGGDAVVTTCAYEYVGPGPDGIVGTEDDEYEEVCSLVTLEVTRTKGKPRFEDVSKELLYIYADIDEDGVVERVPLFDDSLEDYFWSYDNNGLKVLQLRFYEVPTTVPSPDDLGLNQG
ncbi:MAG: hypothetical protein PVG61_03230 [Dehalococcoidia bacterium]|jgi:hypothetical protein